MTTETIEQVLKTFSELVQLLKEKKLLSDKTTTKSLMQIEAAAEDLEAMKDQMMARDIRIQELEEQLAERPRLSIVQ